MTLEDITEKVRTIVGNQIPDHEKGLGCADSRALFYDAGAQSRGDAMKAGNVGLDSLDRVEIIMEIEDVFDLEIPDVEFETNPPNTIAEIAVLVEKALAAKA
jgi:acyl carrier protein